MVIPHWLIDLQPTLAPPHMLLGTIIMDVPVRKATLEFDKKQNNPGMPLKPYVLCSTKTAMQHLKDRVRSTGDLPYKALVRSTGDLPYKAIVRSTGDLPYKALVRSTGDLPYKALKSEHIHPLGARDALS
jgi:hypothetical protein